MRDANDVVGGRRVVMICGWALDQQRVIVADRGRGDQRPEQPTPDASPRSLVASTCAERRSGDVASFPTTEASTDDKLFRSEDFHHHDRLSSR